MHGMSLEKASAMSFVLHVVLLCLVALFSGQPSEFMDKHYVVDIVMPAPQAKPADTRGATPPADKAASKPVTKPAPPKPTPPKPVPPEPVKDTMSLKQEKDSAMKAINELKAKQQKLKDKKDIEQAQQAKDNLLKDMKRRSKLESIRNQAATSATASTSKLSDAQIGRVMSEYERMLHDKIHKAWVFPETGNLALKAVVSITVRTNGQLHVNKIEQPSGDRAFDRSVLNAIRKVGKVEPPPFGEEFEAGIRFSPVTD